ncbi:zinc finger BED domain-containing protein 4-like [Haliotis rubra]|uniref:zinc finger BED domain-containing protein 4-like n=1 Tax=Haliotis rubra TaxID=36100 RepID=UPI001EE6167B|nr:zinc finger BED domain-containing protein 4-like [Haliotis rubra]
MALANESTLSNSAKNTIKACVFSFEEHTLAEKLIKILQPFEKATTIVSAKKNPTLQKIMPIIIKIDNCMKTSDDDPDVIKKVKDVIRQQMAYRTSGDKELISMACVLNPFAKDLEFLSAEDRAFAHDLLLKQAGGVNIASINMIKKEPGTEDVLPHLTNLGIHDEDGKVISVEEDISLTLSPAKRICPAADMDEWLEDVLCTGETVKPREDVVFQEVARYLGSAHTDRQLTLLDWWKKNAQYFPRISGLARKYLAIPASSVPSERVFSLAGNLVNKKRARLSPNNIDLLVFLRKNMELYW